MYSMYVQAQVKGSENKIMRQIFRPAYNKGDNEMIPGAVQRSPGIYLMTEENLS